jgi:hypothetical protein
MTLRDDLLRAKQKLDTMIQQARGPAYRVITGIELLYRLRTGEADLRDPSRLARMAPGWVDTMSKTLYGHKAGQNGNYAKHWFGPMIDSAMLEALAEVNNRTGGNVETYLFFAILAKRNRLAEVRRHLASQPPGALDVAHILARFENDQALKAATGQVYEVVVYALFDVVTTMLGAKVQLILAPPSDDMLRDFDDFCVELLGVPPGQRALEMPARLFRNSTTYGNDGGVDIWANFGPVVQVKHVSLDADAVEEIEGGIYADRIIVVCDDADRRVIEAVTGAVGSDRRIKAIVTKSQIVKWYQTALLPKYSQWTVPGLYNRICEEFDREIPIGERTRFEEVASARGYNEELVVSDWSAW